MEGLFKFEVVNLNGILISYTYSIENLNEFKDDYRRFIFNFIIRKKLSININEFNYNYYNINKIFLI